MKGYDKANMKGKSGMDMAKGKANAKAQPKMMGYANGGLVKSTGKLDTGIRKCGHGDKK